MTRLRDSVFWAATHTPSETRASTDADITSRPPGLVVSNQQKWDTMEAERSGVGRGSGELPEGPVVASSLFDGLSLNVFSAL